MNLFLKDEYWFVFTVTKELVIEKKINIDTD